MIPPTADKLLLTEISGTIVRPNQFFFGPGNFDGYVVFSNWKTFHDEVIFNLTMDWGYDDSREGLSSAIDDVGFSRLYSDYFCLPITEILDFEVFAHSPSNLIVNGILQASGQPETGGNSGSMEILNSDFAEFPNYNVNLGDTVSGAFYDWGQPNPTGYGFYDYGSVSSVIEPNSDDYQAIQIYFNGYVGPEGDTISPSQIKLSENNWLAVISLTTTGPGNTGFFINKEEVLNWFFPDVPPPPDKVSLFGMKYPPKPEDITPETVLVPGHVVPPLEQRIIFQNYTYPVPKYIKGK